MAIDREKYRRMFLEEARESLRAFGNDLVSLEKLHAAGQSDAKATRDVMDAAFRTAHSLKGMGAAMGYTRFADLAHKLEDLADVARQGGDIGTEGFDLLLEGADRLEEMVEMVAGGDEDPPVNGDLTVRVQGTVARLKSPAATPAPPTTTTATATTMTAASPTAKAPARKSGLLVVKVKIADDASLPQVRAFVVHKALAALPGWKETEPTPDSLRTKELPGRTLTVRFDPAAADVAVIEKTARVQQAVADVTFEGAGAGGEGDDGAGASAALTAGVAAAGGAAGVAAAAAAGGAAAGAAAAAGATEDDRTVRVRTALLDDLLDSVGELLLARSRIKTIANRVDLPDLADLVDEVDRLTRDLHGRVVAARMTPLAFMTERFPRVVRDLARAEKKSIDFSMIGTEIELDRAILDELSAPFLHMLRNAVDHAHEGDDARKAAGKNAAMKLVLRASRERDTVLLELIDDGGGMDAARIRKRAVDRGLISQQHANALTDAQSLELICLPGFSTVEQVSQTSGRGVGMDVVKATLERLGGSLRIESQPGQGTRMVLQLPLTVAIIQVLVVEAGGGAAGGKEAYAIPVTRVEQALELSSAGVSVAHGRTFMKHGAALVPLFDLGNSLGYPAPPPSSSPPPSRPGTVILVGRGKDVAAIRVDAILGQEEVVAKPLGPPLSSFGYLAGATLLADGRAAFILEPLRLVQGGSILG